MHVKVFDKSALQKSTAGSRGRFWMGAHFPLLSPLTWIVEHNNRQWISTIDCNNNNRRNGLLFFAGCKQFEWSRSTLLFAFISTPQITINYNTLDQIQINVLPYWVMSMNLFITNRHQRATTDALGGGGLVQCGVELWLLPQVRSIDRWGEKSKHAMEIHWLWAFCTALRVHGIIMGKLADFTTPSTLLLRINCDQ